MYYCYLCLFSLDLTMCNLILLTWWAVPCGGIVYCVRTCFAIDLNKRKEPNRWKPCLWMIVQPLCGTVWMGCGGITWRDWDELAPYGHICTGNYGGCVAGVPADGGLRWLITQTLGQVESDLVFNLMNALSWRAKNCSKIRTRILRMKKYYLAWKKVCHG